MGLSRIMNEETVLITGASSGIGLALAREFAQHGHPLVLTAPVEAELRSLATDLARIHGVKARIIAKDLARETAPQEIFNELAREDIQIEILVNNAGLGQRGKFWETPLDRDITILRVNAEAVLRMTKLFLPMMVQRGHGRIMNTASIAGFEPGPLLAVYHATKAFVLSLSEALATELEDTAVTVTALCPGPVDTDFFPKAEMIDSEVFQRGNVMAPQEVARAGYEALMRGDRITIPGATNKAMVFSRRLMPEAAQAKINEKLYSPTDPAERKRERGDVEAGAEKKD